MDAVKQILDSFTMHLHAKIRYKKSYMLLGIHCSPKAKSSAAGHFFLRWIPQDRQPTKLNGPIHVLTSLLRFVAASAAEAELDALFINA